MNPGQLDSAVILFLKYDKLGKRRDLWRDCVSIQVRLSPVVQGISACSRTS